MVEYGDVVREEEAEGRKERRGLIKRNPRWMSNALVPQGDERRQCREVNRGGDGGRLGLGFFSARVWDGMVRVSK